MKNGLSVSSRRPGDDVVGCERLEAGRGEHLLSWPALPTPPAVNIYCSASSAILMKFLVGMVGGEGCYFSNNRGFVGMGVLYKGRGLGLFDFSVPLIRIPYASGHRRGLFCFFSQSPSHASLRGTPPWGCGRSKGSCGLCLQEPYRLNGKIEACTEKAEAKPDAGVQHRRIGRWPRATARAELNR